MLNKHVRCIALGIAALAIAAAFMFSAPLHAQNAASARPGFSLVWRKAVPMLRDLDISPQGARLALLTMDKRIAVWDAPSARPIWSKPCKAGTDVRISDGVGYVFVFDPMNPANRSISFYDAATGRVVATKRTDGAIWDLTLSDSGDFMSVGTGKYSLYIYMLDVYPSYHRRTLRGVCNALDFSPDGSFIAVGLWNASGVDCFDTTGKLLTSVPGASTKRFEPSVTRNSNFVLATQYINHQKSDPVLTLWRRDGSRVWSHGMGPNAFNVHALTSPSGDFTVASYYKDIVRDRTWVPERSLVVLDSTGHPIYEIGGLYLALTLMCLSPDNSGFIAYDGDRTLYRFSRNGNALGTWPLSAPIRDWARSHGAKYLLINTLDNELTLLQMH